MLWYEQGTTSQYDFYSDPISQNSGSSACCACCHPRHTINEVWALVNDQRERSLNSGVQHKYYPDVVQPKLISHATARVSASHRRPSTESCGHNILPFLPSMCKLPGRPTTFFGWQSAYFRRRFCIVIGSETILMKLIMGFWDRWSFWSVSSFIPDNYPES